MNIFLRKLRSAAYYACRDFEALRQRRQEARAKERLSQWFSRLEVANHEVLVGANFVDFGGCRHHMHAIRNFSSCRLELVPDAEAIAQLGVGVFGAEETQRRFAALKLPQLKTVHSHVFPWFIDWCAARKKQGVRWVHTHHNWYYPEFGKDGLEDWQQQFNEAFLFATRHCDVPLSVSRWQQRFLREEHGLETHYLPNGVDVTLCDRADPRRFSRPGLSTPFVLYAGRNDPVKNPAEFVKLAAALPDLSFLMVGQGLSAAIIREEWSEEVPPNLRIEQGLSHADLLDAMAASAAVVVTSKREGLPTLVLEAMALGKPVVVPTEDGCVEAVGAGEFGHIYRLGDIADLAEKTLAALADPTKAALARQRVLEEYDWRVVAPKLDAIYRGEDLG
jgi:glycosyltransferase involved in cell wall biosynthesis